MSFRHLWAVIKKEFQHIMRDRGTLIMVLFTPTAVLLVMAYSLTVDIQNVPIAVLDYDQSQTSRTFIQQILAGQDLELYAYATSMDEINQMLTTGEIKAALILDPTFGNRVSTFQGLPMQIIVDGTEPTSGAFALQHILSRANQFISKLMGEQFAMLNISEQDLSPIDLRVRTWYNPSLKPRVDMIPGLISLVLGFPALSVALTLAHEREHGTMEQLMATPISRTELLVGKMVPYILVGLLNAIFIPILAIIWFNIPFNGSFVLFFVLSAIFLFAILSMGIILGVFIHSQAAALALSFLVIFFPGFFLTGIFFPIISMPEIMRLESLFLPGTHYAIITRGIFLTGLGLDILWPYAVMLVGLGMVFTAVAALFFRKKLG